ncbi:MAG: hypothetical protein SNJ75_01335 [Gemmataceae bacterium]
MYNRWFTALHRSFGERAFQIYGKTRQEPDWRVLDVMATQRRNAKDGWMRPLWAGTLITWTDTIIACGWDVAAEVIREQRQRPVSREHPLEVCAGRLRDPERRRAAGGQPWPSCSEILAHEVGHSIQARRLSWLYLPKGGIFTLWREGEGWWHTFENQASEQGQFGGVVPGSVHPRLWPLLSKQQDD